MDGRINDGNSNQFFLLVSEDIVTSIQRVIGFFKWAMSQVHIENVGFPIVINV